MQQASHKGYVLRGHAIAQQVELLAPDRYAASGTITRNNRLVESSGVIGAFSSEEEAQSADLEGAIA